MVNENLIKLIENKKPVETIQEVKDYEVKKSPLSPTARGKVINKSGSNYLSGSREGYGPTYYPNSVMYQECPPVNLDSVFSIEYRIDGGWHDKRFFEFKGIHDEYSSVWKIGGKLEEIYKAQERIENGRVKAVKIGSMGNYQRMEDVENEVKDQLRKDIRDFELAVRDGKRISRSVSGVFQWVNAYNNVCYKETQTARNN